MAGEARRLVVDAFHQAAVAGDHPGAVIDQLVAEFGVEVALGDRHADRHGEALPERPGGRLDARRAGNSPDGRRRAAELAEVADVVDRRPRVAGQVEQGVDQHRAVAGRQHEAVAVGPFRIGRIVLQIFASTARSRRRPCPSACPGWPILAASTASIARARMALASRRRDGHGFSTGRAAIAFGWPRRCVPLSAGPCRVNLAPLRAPARSVAAWQRLATWVTFGR